MTDHLLDLSESLGRETVKLADGTVVELRNPSELGALDEFKLRRLMEEVNSYDPSKMKTEEDAQAASTTMHSLAAMILVDPLVELDDGSCAAIFGAWIEKYATEADPPKPSRAQRRSTGATSSRASKRSTAATR